MRKTTETELLAENAELRARLDKAEQTLAEIRRGEVAAIAANAVQVDQVYSLAGAESVYRLIVETMTETALTVSPEGAVLFANAQFAKLLRRPLEQIIGRPLIDFVAAEHSGAVHPLLLGSQVRTMRQRLKFVDANGTTVPTHVSTKALSQPAGASICMVVADLTDLENSTEVIQELCRQQEALQESEERFRQLADAAFEGLVIHEDGIMLDANSRVIEMVGHDRASLIGKAFWEFIEPGCHDLVKENVRTGTTAIYEVDLIHRDGRLVPVEVMGRSLAWHGRQVRAAALRDIAERKRAEGVLATSTADLKAANETLRDSRRAALNLVKDAVEARRQAETANAALARHAAELKDANTELTRFNNAMVDREMRMIELKKQVNELCARAGLPQRYNLELGKENA